ncbi:MAG: lysophospholipid acyltransferase family protein [Pseudomonadota bacterium]
MLQSIARFLLRLGGWTLVGKVPTAPKAVLIAAPHTSNWDGIWGLIAKVAFDLDVRFFGKESLFWFPLGVLLRGMGGIPLDRSRPGSTVTQAIEAFAAEEKLYIAMAPEGTRSRREHWKSGFYRIATGAKVPLVLAFFDYEARRLGIGMTLELTGDPERDMHAIREFYAANMHGRHPEKTSTIALPPE